MVQRSEPGQQDYSSDDPTLKPSKAQLSYFLILISHFSSMPDRAGYTAWCANLIRLHVLTSSGSKSSKVSLFKVSTPSCVACAVGVEEK